MPFKFNLATIGTIVFRNVTYLFSPHACSVRVTHFLGYFRGSISLRRYILILIQNQPFRFLTDYGCRIKVLCLPTARQETMSSRAIESLGSQSEVAPLKKVNVDDRVREVPPALG